MTDCSLGSHVLGMEKTYSLLLPIHYQCKIISFSTFPQQVIMQNRIKFNFMPTHPLKKRKIWLLRKDSSFSLVTVHSPMGLITGYNDMVLHVLRAGICFGAWSDCSSSVRLVPKDVLILLFHIIIRNPLHYTGNLLIYRLFFLHKKIRCRVPLMCIFLFIYYFANL